MDTTPTFLVIFRCEPKDEYDNEEIIRYCFSSLDAITRRLPKLLDGRLYEVTAALDACNMTLDKMVAFLADRKNLCTFLELGNGVTAVCAPSMVYN